MTELTSQYYDATPAGTKPAAVAAHAGRRPAGIERFPGHHRRAGPRRSRQSLFVPRDSKPKISACEPPRVAARGPQSRSASTWLFARRRRVKGSRSRRVLKAIAQSLAMEVRGVTFASRVFEAVAVEHRHASSHRFGCSKMLPSEREDGSVATLLMIVCAALCGRAVKDALYLDEARIGTRAIGIGPERVQHALRTVRAHAKDGPARFTSIAPVTAARERRSVEPILYFE